MTDSVRPGPFRFRLGFTKPAKVSGTVSPVSPLRLNVALVSTLWSADRRTSTVVRPAGTATDSAMTP